MTAPVSAPVSVPVSAPVSAPTATARRLRPGLPGLRGLVRRARRHLRDESGVVTVEFVIVVPMLFWAYLMTFVFSDAFRERSLDIKASYTIADTLSREQAVVTPAYLDALYALHGLMTGQAPEDRRLRITTLKMVGTNPNPVMGWSQGRGGIAGRTQADVDTIRSRIPAFQSGETMVLVETWQDYAPGFDTGIGEMEFSSLVTMKLRFAPQLCYSSASPPVPASTTC